MNFETKNKIQEVTNHIEEVKYVVSENINSALKRGIQLDDINQKASELDAHAQLFQKKTTSLKRKFCCINAKVWVLGFLACGISLYVVLVLSCRGLDLPECR